MCSLIVERVVLYMSIASNFLTGLFKSYKLCWLFLLPDLSVTETEISHYYWPLTMALSNPLHFALYIWGNAIIYIWIWNYHIFQLNHFLLFRRNCFIVMCFFVFICVSLLFIIFFILLLSTFLYHCILVVFLAEHITIQLTISVLQLIFIPFVSIPIVDVFCFVSII